MTKEEQILKIAQERNFSDELKDYISVFKDDKPYTDLFLGYLLNNTQDNEDSIFHKVDLLVPYRLNWYDDKNHKLFSLLKNKYLERIKLFNEIGVELNESDRKYILNKLSLAGGKFSFEETSNFLIAIELCDVMNMCIENQYSFEVKRLKSNNLDEIEQINSYQYMFMTCKGIDLDFLYNFTTEHKIKLFSVEIDDNLTTLYDILFLKAKEK